MRWAMRCRSVVFDRVDERLAAHGQVVWFWHPDADAKFAETIRE
jgi:mannose/fructose/N-acetylgalactosamine-specific phosphotransferase system component IIB